MSLPQSRSGIRRQSGIGVRAAYRPRHTVFTYIYLRLPRVDTGYLVLLFDPLFFCIYGSIKAWLRERVHPSQHGDYH